MDTITYNSHTDRTDCERQSFFVLYSRATASRIIVAFDNSKEIISR